MKTDKAIILIIGYYIVLIVGTLTLTAGLARHYDVRERTEAPEPAIKAVSSPVSERTAEIWRITAYCPCEKCCGRFSDGITASGSPAKGKLIAAPKFIPFHTWIDIPGYGYAEVLDRGSAIKGKRLDLLFPDHQSALNWGVQYLEIEL